MTAPGPVAVLIATQNLNAVLRIMQWGVIALIFLFFLRVIRAVWVEMSPATIRKPRSLRRQERREERVAAGQPPAPLRLADGSRKRQLHLKVVQPPEHAGRTYDLDDELTIGRSPGCGVAMPEDIYTLDTARPPLPPRRPTLGRGPRLDQWDVRELRTDHAGGAPGQGRPPPDRFHRLRGLPLTVLRSGSASDVGRVRNVNQDLPLERPNLYAVADGMGGHVGGEVAARVAVETLEQAFERAPTVEGLRQAFSEANAAVWQESQANADLRGMGTTLTAVALVSGPEGKDVLALANVGDSRAYLFSGGDITQVTDDHSLAEERMRQGEMTVAEAAVHPQRHILTRALGVSSQVDADMWELELRSGDRLLLCSDGLTNEVGSDEMADILGEVDDPTEAAQRLVDTANGHGGADNITVVVVDVQVGEEGDGTTSKVTPLETRRGRLRRLPGRHGGGPGGGASPRGGRRARIGPRAQPACARRRRRPPTGHCPMRRRSSPRSAWTRRWPRAPASSSAASQRHWPRPGRAATSSSWARAAAVPVARSTARVPPPPASGWRDKPEGKESRGARRRRMGIPRRITPRVIGFVILVGRRAGGGLLRPQVVRLRQLDRDGAG